jgi:SAM-dependent methyltransferase
LAKTVFAVEPATSLRQFIKEKSLAEKTNNIFVIDGFLSSIPLPENTADVLITSQAIGWNLEDELKEIERVVKPGGYAIHLLSYPDTETNSDLHDYLTNAQWKYTYSSHNDNDGIKQKYWKIIK